MTIHQCNTCHKCFLDEKSLIKLIATNEQLRKAGILFPCEHTYHFCDVDCLHKFVDVFHTVTHPKV